MKTIEIQGIISGTKIFLPFTAICSVTNKEFSGEVIIEYHPKKLVLEYCDAEAVVTRIAKKLITAEELAQQIFQDVEQSIKPSYLKVLIDVKHSDAHRPVQVWIEKGLV
ncbi:MAG: GTP cyclohydrolase I [Microgenomates group bacterium]